MVSNGILGPNYGCFANCLSAAEVRPRPSECDIPLWLWSEEERFDNATKQLLAAEAAEEK